MAKLISAFSNAVASRVIKGRLGSIKVFLIMSLAQLIAQAGKA
jgi:hypothetical protein